MTDEERALARRVPLEAFNEGKLDVVDEAFSPHFVSHWLSISGMPSGREGVKALITQLRFAFPDFTYTLDREVAEGDLLVQHLTATGTMTADFMGMKASDKQACWQEIHITRLEYGKAAEHWAVIDRLGMMQQLGFIPLPEQEAQAA